MLLDLTKPYLRAQAGGLGGENASGALLDGVNRLCRHKNDPIRRFADHGDRRASDLGPVDVGQPRRLELRRIDQPHPVAHRGVEQFTVVMVRLDVLHVDRFKPAHGLLADRDYRPVLESTGGDHHRPLRLKWAPDVRQSLDSMPASGDLNRSGDEADKRVDVAVAAKPSTHAACGAVESLRTWRKRPQVREVETDCATSGTWGDVAQRAEVAIKPPIRTRSGASNSPFDAGGFVGCLRDEAIGDRFKPRANITMQRRQLRRF